MEPALLGIGCLVIGCRRRSFLQWMRRVARTVVAFDAAGRPATIVEKPENPPSNIAVTGLYFYDNDVLAIAKALRPSPRGELEITDVNAVYLKRGDLHVELLGCGSAWLDTGTHASLIQVIEERQGLKVACPEEIAWRMHYIDDSQLKDLAGPLLNSGYGLYLLDILKREQR